MGNQMIKHLYAKSDFTVIRAAAADPQNVWQTIFTITGGIVWVKALIGLRTVIQAGGASTMQFQHSVGPTALDAGTGTITGDTVNTMYWLTGDVTDPIQIGVGGIPIMMGKVVATSITYGGMGILAFTGNIQVTMTAAAGTGSTSYICIWTPVSIGANLVAA